MKNQIIVPNNRQKFRFFLEFSGKNSLISENKIFKKLPNVEVVALLAVLGESFCNDLVLELILDLLLFKLDIPFLSALNILKLFLGATTLLA